MESAKQLVCLGIIIIIILFVCGKSRCIVGIIIITPSTRCIVGGGNVGDRENFLTNIQICLPCVDETYTADHRGNLEYGNLLHAKVLAEAERKDRACAREGGGTAGTQTTDASTLDGACARERVVVALHASPMLLFPRGNGHTKGHR